MANLISNFAVFCLCKTEQLIEEYSNELPQAPKVSYLTEDHLGSPRIITDNDKDVVSRHDYLAFGDEVTQTVGNVAGRTTAQGYGNDDDIRKQYTGYERDKESGLDYAQARYYNSNHGRFTSVDPLTASASIRNPQTFNRYSYVLNSPYKFVDPLGLISQNSAACGSDCANRGGNSMAGMGIGLFSTAGQTIGIGSTPTIEVVNIGSVDILGNKIEIYAPKGTSKKQVAKIMSNMEAVAKRVNETGEAASISTQAEMTFNSTDQSRVSRMKQIVTFDGETYSGTFKVKGLSNVSDKDSFSAGQQDIETATWFAPDLAGEIDVDIFIAGLAHEGLHQEEYKNDPEKWIKESKTEKGRHEREVRAYTYELDFYTRFSGADKNKPNEHMRNLKKLIKKPYQGPPQKEQK